MALRRGRRARADGPRIVAPQPPQRIRQNGRTVPRVVALRAHHELAVVARVFERLGHRLVGQVPRARVNVQVVRAVLQEYAQRFGLHDADQVGVPVAAAQVGKTADEAEHAAKGVGALPGGGEGGDAAGAGPGDGAVVGVAGEPVPFGHFGKDSSIRKRA